MEYVRQHLIKLTDKDLVWLFRTLFPRVILLKTRDKAEQRKVLIDYLMIYYRTHLDEKMPNVPRLGVYQETKYLEEEVEILMTHKERDTLARAVYIYFTYFPKKMWKTHIAKKLWIKNGVYGIILKRRKFPTIYPDPMSHDYQRMKIDSDDIVELEPYEDAAANGHRFYGFYTPNVAALDSLLKRGIVPEFLYKTSYTGDLIGLLVIRNGFFIGKVDRDQFSYWRLAIERASTKFIHIYNWIFGLGCGSYRKFHSAWLEAHQINAYQLQWDDAYQQMFAKELRDWLLFNEINGIILDNDESALVMVDLDTAVPLPHPVDDAEKVTVPRKSGAKPHSKSIKKVAKKTVRKTIK